MNYGRLLLAIGALWSSQALAGEWQQPVYVAPGGVYISSAQVYVPGGNGVPPYPLPGAGYYHSGWAYYQPSYVPPGPAYVPGYAPPGPAYVPGYAPPPHFFYGDPGYGLTRSLYPAPPPTYFDQYPAYISPYAGELPPRPPAPVPYN
ncbi:MAG TPA: hypothetical protein VGJ20_06890 [Xanthobacteraceae bacterium]|jgi:hypothetical protein